MTDFRNANVALKATGKTSASPGAWPITFPSPPPAMKGLCNGMKTQTDIDHLNTINPDWFYTYSNTMNLATTQNMPWQGQRFVPMMWSDNPTRVAQIPAVIAAPDTPDHILGFNEPDSSSQANMTVDEALTLWPQLEAMGLRLGSPACTGTRTQWFADFMAGVAAQGRRVDFIACHIYQQPSVSTFIGKIDELWNLYQRPVWVTEFAVYDFNASSTVPNAYTRAQVNTFMQAVIPEMRKRPWLERFAWHGRTISDPVGGISSLYNDDGTLTSTGIIYRDI
jgi:hypothetical protein